MNLPKTFIKNIQLAFGEDGNLWLKQLPHLINLAAQQWQLSLREPFLLSYNYVCRASLPNGESVVLKIGLPTSELISEISALQHWGGKAAVRLINQDIENGFLLLQKLNPGTMLADLKDDEQATHIAAELLNQLWMPAPAELHLIKLSDWFASLSKLRPRFGGGPGPFPQKLIDRVESILPELFTDSNLPTLLHGDFHHTNILKHGKQWLAIDPKGVIGPRAYECGPFLMNPLGFIYQADAKMKTQKRVAILREHLNLERELIINWAICHSLLSGWWDLAEDNSGASYAIACAELFMSI